MGTRARLAVGGARQRLALLSNIPTPYRIAFLNTLHRELGERGGALQVLFCAEREPNRRWELPLEKQRYAWEIMPGFQFSFLGAHMHWNPSVIRRLVAFEPTYLLVAGAWNSPTMVRVALTRKLSGSRIFWSEGHADAVRFAGGPVSRVRRRVLRSYDAFAVPNQRSAEFLRFELGPEIATLPLPNTVDEEFYRKAANGPRQAIRRALSIAPAECVIVSVAELSPRKGVLELCRAYAALPAAERQRSSLNLVGEGELRGQIEALSRQMDGGTIRLTGQLAPESVRDWLTAADLFVLASRSDPNPLSVIEAAFAGLPLLISRRAGNATDLVQKGRNGALLNSFAPTSIARQLARFIALDRAQLSQMGRSSIELAERDFSRETVARRFLDALSVGFSPSRPPGRESLA